MRIQCNAGTRVTNLIGDLPGYRPVWFDPRAIANILSLKLVKEKYRIEYNSNGDDGFVVTKPTGEVFRFIESASGLHYLDASEREETKIENTTLVVNTVKENRRNYTNNDYLRAMRARELQITMGRPSTTTFLDLLKKNGIANCPVTPADVEAAEYILGPDIGSLKGKTTRQSLPIVDSPVTAVPADVLQEYRKVTLCVDIMYVNRVAMLVSISRKIRFGTLEVIPNNKSTVLLKGLKSILQVYQRRGFQIEMALMDGEFGHLRGDLASMGVTLNETSRDEHVGEIERFIRTIKEWMRAIYNTLPFRKIPAQLVAEMGEACVFWLNSLPPQSNFGNDLSPRTIVTGQRLDFKRHCRFQLGEYVQTHEQHNNSMMSRTVGALALRPTGNAQGGFYFLSLSTGRVLNRLRATALPMPDNVVDQVHQMARQQRANPGLMFGSRSHVGTANGDDMDDVSDDEEDENYMPGEQEGDESEDAHEEDENGQHDHDYEDVGSIVSEPSEHADDDATNMGDVEVETEMEVSSGRSPDGYGAGTGATPDVVDAKKRTNNHVESEGVDGPDVESEGVDEQNNDVMDPDGDEVELVEERNDNHSSEDQSLDSVETHDDANKKTGYNLRSNQMQQLHDRKVMQPVDRKGLSQSQKKEALGYLMFLKKKRCGAIKGHGCADG